MQADTLSDWLKEFAVLHGRAKQGELVGEEKAEYAKARDELAEAMLIAQLSGPTGTAGQRRRSLRVAQALQVQIESPRGTAMAITLDVSTGGFSTIVSYPLEVGTLINFKLKLARGQQPVEGGARVVNALPQSGSVRMGVAFTEMAPADRERLEFVIVDAVLKQFGV
jgi:c-di-GMP-binding flagellar brake protein YcgR